MLGFAALTDSGQARAQNSAAPSSQPPTDRQQTEAALHKLKEEARSDEQAAQDKGSTATLQLARELDVESLPMRELLKKMHELADDYHLSETTGETKALRAQWIKLLETGRKIHRRMVEAALKDYEAEPDPKSETAAFLYSVAWRNTNVDRYEGMLEVMQALKSSGFTDQDFDLCFGLTAAAHNEFELAQPHLEIALKNIEKDGKELASKRDVPEEMRESVLKKMSDMHALLSELSNVEYYRPLWEKEQKQREADASGEPLPRVQIETTKGTFEIELFEDQAPNTVANFISLCEQDFYDGLPFHRVLTHFMAQGGCPNRDGTGGPGYSIPTELNENSRNFFRGTVGMALSAQPDSAGSQFFICYLPRAYLNGKFVAFGRVVEGMSVLSDLTHIDPDDKDKQHTHGPADEIISTRVVRKRNHAYEPKKMPQAKSKD
jgi:cyclophilin family peptidyl-prolyl cis-trans isomerase